MKRTKEEKELTKNKDEENNLKRKEKAPLRCSSFEIRTSDLFWD